MQPDNKRDSNTPSVSRVLRKGRHTLGMWIKNSKRRPTYLLIRAVNTIRKRDLKPCLSSCLPWMVSKHLLNTLSRSKSHSVLLVITPTGIRLFRSDGKFRNVVEYILRALDGEKNMSVRTGKSVDMTWEIYQVCKHPVIWPVTLLEECH
jgi:hypothetical protein